MSATDGGRGREGGGVKWAVGECHVFGNLVSGTVVCRGGMMG
jgi:hypothetical protein